MQWIENKIEEQIEKVKILPTKSIIEEFDNLLSTLSTDEIELLEKYKQKRNQYEFLGARYLLKCLYLDYRGLEESYIHKLNIARHPSKSPLLYDNGKLVKDLYYSIAHRKDYIFVALDSKYKIGIDVEQIHSKILKLKSKIIGEEEEKLLNDSGYVESEELYTRIWTAKECIVKIVNQNLFKVLSESKIKSIDNDKVILSFPFDGKLKEITCYSFVFDDYAFAYALY